MELKVKIYDPILRCYLNSLFERHNDGYIASTTTLTGAAICSLVKACDAPRADTTPDMVKVVLPYNFYTEQFRAKFLTLSADAEQMVNVTLKKEFDINFLAFCTEMKIHGMKFKDIIPLFITVNKLDIIDGDIEMLKKRYYRTELKLMSKTKELLRQKAYYAFREIRKIALSNVTY